jgi:hypothetical protein
MGTRPLPFYYKYNDTFQTQHMTWKHTLGAILIVMLMMAILIQEYFKLGKITSITTRIGFYDELESINIVNSQKIDMGLEVVINKIGCADLLGAWNYEFVPMAYDKQGDKRHYLGNGLCAKSDGKGGHVEGQEGVDYEIIDKIHNLEWGEGGIRFDECV